MSTITKTYTFATGATVVAAEHNTNYDTIYNEFNGSIDNNNIKANAAIVDTKLAQITTASKVHGTALTGLASVVSGAGRLPTANLDTTGVFSALGLTEQSNSVSTAAGQGKLYTKEVSSQSELFFRTDSAGDEVQLTNGGGLGGFGTWVSRSINTEYTASTNGFAVGSVYATLQDGETMTVSVETPTGTARQSAIFEVVEDDDNSISIPFMIPVKAGDTWKVVVTGTSDTSILNWLPL